ncbi:hypothetical protein NQZ79_g35 [Umbelopsis isabellina]|nr:hypothetical protein NQZ79_g35 [Umbelopsis isabellina]
MLCDVEIFSIRIPRSRARVFQGNDYIVMGLARILVDLYGVSAAVRNVTTNLAKVEVGYATHHLKTSSLVNATKAAPQQQPVTSQDSSPQSQQTSPELSKDIEDITAQWEHTQKEIDNVSILRPSQQAAETTHNNTAKFEADGQVSPLKNSLTNDSRYPNGNKKEISKSNVESHQTSSNRTQTSVGPEPLASSQNDILLASTVETPESELETTRRVLKSSRIPTSRTSRLWHYGSLATAMGFGAMNESLKRMTGVSKSEGGKHSSYYCKAM